jgi:hypothetical protein
VFLRSVRRLLVTANVVLISLILVTLMMESLQSSKTSVLTRATRRNILGDDILHAARPFLRNIFLKLQFNFNLLLTISSETLHSHRHDNLRPHAETLSPPRHISADHNLYFCPPQLRKQWRMVSSGLLRRVALVRTDVSEEPGASFIGVTLGISSQLTSVASCSLCCSYEEWCLLGCYAVWLL